MARRYVRRHRDDGTWGSAGVYTSPHRDEMVMEHLRECDRRGEPVCIRDVTGGLSDLMSTKTSWKVIRSLAEEGRVILTREDAPPYRTWITLEEWEAMSDDMKERAVTALEEIAVQLRRMNDSRDGHVPRAWPDYETKTTVTDRTGGTR